MQKRKVSVKATRSLAICMLCVAPLLAAVACGGGSTNQSSTGSNGGNSSSGENGKLQTVAIGISPIAIYSAGYEMKERLMKAGIKPEYKEFSATPDRLAALANGSIDMSFAGFTDTVKLDSQGQHIVMVSNAATKGYAIVAKKGEGIKSIADLKGKTIAIPKGTIQEMTVIFGFQKAGLNAMQDANLVQSSYSAMPIALSKGDVDAFVGTAPYNSIAVAKGYGQFVPLPNNLPWGYLNSGFVTTNKYLQNNSKTVKTVVTALKQTTQALNQNQANLKSLYVSKFKVPKNAVDLVAKHVNLTTTIQSSQVKGLIDAEKTVGYIKTKPSVSEVIQPMGD